MKDNNDFEVSVMTQLTEIRTILKEMDYKEVEKIARRADNTSCTNQKEIERITSSNLWLSRSVAGVALAVVVEVILKFI